MSDLAQTIFDDLTQRNREAAELAQLRREIDQLRAEVRAQTEVAEDKGRQVRELRAELASALQDRNDLLALAKAWVMVWPDKLAPESLAEFNQVEERILQRAAGKLFALAAAKGGAK